MSQSVLNKNTFQSVWFRRTKIPDFSNNISWEEKIYLAGEVDAFMKNIFLIIQASKWLSYPSAVYRAENKLLQLKFAQEVGFTIPDTLVTNSKNDIRQFFYINKGNVIIKPISQTRLSNRQSTSFFFTSIITEEIIASLETFDLTPCIFQVKIEKEYEIRVTVVADKVFAASVYSQEDEETKIDWRKKKLDFHEIKLPKNIEIFCKKLVRKLGLNFGAIDLIRTTSGKYIFLEINPNGQWAWIENQTGMNISGAIIDFLTNE